MSGGTVLASVTRVVGAIVVMASAGCDGDITRLSKGKTYREAQMQEHALQVQITLDVAAIVIGMNAAEGLPLASVQPEP